MSHCNFSYNHYRDILKKALKMGFIITNFRDADKFSKKTKTIILRHDIDYLPKRALAMAKIEEKLGIKSTYFVRVHGEYYHAFDRQSYLAIKKIAELGHELSLHSEARNLAREFKMGMVKLFRLEKEMLEKIFQLKIVSASEHADLGRSKNYWQKHLFTLVDKKKVGIKHYPQEFQDFKYLSDSLGCWKEGCLCQNLAKFAKIQALVHPDWWGPEARQEIASLIKKNPLVKNAKIFNSRKRKI